MSMVPVGRIACSNADIAENSSEAGSPFSASIVVSSSVPNNRQEKALIANFRMSFNGMTASTSGT